MLNASSKFECVLSIIQNLMGKKVTFGLLVNEKSKRRSTPLFSLSWLLGSWTWRSYLLTSLFYVVCCVVYAEPKGRQYTREKSLSDTRRFLIGEVIFQEASFLGASRVFVISPSILTWSRDRSRRLLNRPLCCHVLDHTRGNKLSAGKKYILF